MKNGVLFYLLVFMFFACKNADQNDTAHEGQVVTADSAAIADAIHGFFHWYDTFLMDTTVRIEFTDASGEHLKLDQANLESYYSHFRNSGFVSDEFIANEYAFFKKCEQLWQNEAVDDIPSCLDADKYFCAQDWEINFWTQSPVRIQSLGDNKVYATLYGSDSAGSIERSFELKKENEKWVLLKVECDMGI
ncbi:MAG: DUF3828 domain-containing protein [Bacteroidia bacterium]|nr:DUF3828 domain-containing protein [Bacteroidia bacterium]